MRAARKRIPRRGSFTLVELLVVVAIIAILAAMLLPALKSAKDKAKAAQCTNALKQIYLFHMAYAEDYNNIIIPGVIAYPFPPYANTSWSGWMRYYKYLPAKPLACPSNPNPWPIPSLPWHDDFAMVSERGGKRFDSIVPPTERVFLTDSFLSGFGYSWYLIAQYQLTSTNVFIYYHNGGANQVMMDGHAEWRKQGTFAN